MSDNNNQYYGWKKALKDPANHPHFHADIFGGDSPFASEVMEELTKEEPTSKGDKVLTPEEKVELVQKYIKL